jgi:hypothetical protein
MTYTSRTVLAALFPGKTALGTVLGRMVKRGVIAETRLGYRLTQMRAALPEWRPPQPLPEHARPLLAAIIRRAHKLRERGLVTGAAELLREAAAKVAPHPAAQDLAALADLFEHAPTLYPVLDLPQRAAA